MLDLKDNALAIWFKDGHGPSIHEAKSSLEVKLSYMWRPPHTFPLLFGDKPHNFQSYLLPSNRVNAL